MEGRHKGVDEAGVEFIQYESERCVWNGKSEEYSANAEKTFRYIFILVASTFSAACIVFPI